MKNIFFFIFIFKLLFTIKIYIIFAASSSKIPVLFGE